MQNRRKLWTLHKMAEAYSTRPSALVGVEDPYSAWCLDEVAYAWGRSVDDAVSTARYSEDDPERGGEVASAELARLLRDPVEEEVVEEAVPTGRFRDPAPDFAAARARRRPT